MIIYTSNNILKTTSILLACSNENIMFKEVIRELVNAYEKKFVTKIKISFGRPLNFITDKRSFSAKPSNFFINNFKFKYDIKKGFDEQLVLFRNVLRLEKAWKHTKHEIELEDVGHLHSMSVTSLMTTMTHFNLKVSHADEVRKKRLASIIVSVD